MGKRPIFIKENLTVIEVFGIYSSFFLGGTGEFDLTRLDAPHRDTTMYHIG